MHKNVLMRTLKNAVSFLKKHSMQTSVFDEVILFKKNCRYIVQFCTLFLKKTEIWINFV